MTPISPLLSFKGTAVTAEVPQQITEKPQENKKKNFSDPLMQWPVRGLAFSNDIGAAIMDIAPKAGTAFWVPALMYFGADIYDKYRNDKDSYDPDAKRGLKQALFQTFASIVFPIAAVHAGQKTASVLAGLGKTGLSLETREDIINHHKSHMSHVKFSETCKDVETYKKMYGIALDNYIDEHSRTQKFKNPFKFIGNMLFGGKRSEKSSDVRKEKVHSYINKRIDNIYSNWEMLMQNKKPEKMSAKMFAKFHELQQLYKNDALHSTDYVEKAAKDTLKLMEERQVFKVKLLKSLGGFIALGIFIKPIDKFVENIIIKKLIEPGLSKFGNRQVEEFKEKVLN